MADGFFRMAPWPTKRDLRILVCGGRDYTDRNLVLDVLGSIHTKQGIAMIICGMARGADLFAAEWATSHGVPLDPYPISRPDWRRYGKSAGPRRNEQMLRASKPDCGIAFPGGNGTKNMVDLMRADFLSVLEPRGD